MKIKIIKLGDGCNLTVTIIDRQGMPLKLATLKSLVISLVSDRAQNVPFIANSDNTLTIALTYVSNLTKTGAYQIRVEGELSDGQVFDYTEQIIEVKDWPVSNGTTFITSLVLRDVHNVIEKELPEVNYKELGYETFNPFKAYTKDNIVIFGDSLYKFTEDKTAGIWDESKVKATNVSEGTDENYSDLSNKPQINGHELDGNKTGEQLGLADQSTTYTKTEVDEQIRAASTIIIGNTTVDVSRIVEGVLSSLQNGLPSLRVEELTIARKLDAYIKEGNALTSGAGAPDILPQYNGQEYFDTTNKVWYKASYTGTEPTASAWKQITN